MIEDTALVLSDGDSRYIACPVCALPFTVPSGGLWTAPTIPEHDTP